MKTSRFFCARTPLLDKQAFDSAGLLIIRGKKSQISRDFWRQIRGEYSECCITIFARFISSSNYFLLVVNC